MGPDVHMRRTFLWAVDEGFSKADAEAIARADTEYDHVFPVKRSVANTTRHFAPPAWFWSRLYFAHAVRERDLRSLGYAMHAAQDGVAHGTLGENHIKLRLGIGRHPDVWEDAPEGIRERIEKVSRSRLRRFRDLTGWQDERVASDAVGGSVAQDEKTTDGGSGDAVSGAVCPPEEPGVSCTPDADPPRSAPVRDRLTAAITAAMRAAIDEGRLNLDSPPEVTLERPRDPAHGDWSTNVAMVSARDAGLPPRQVAEILALELRERLADTVDAVEVAGPGFINFRLSARTIAEVVSRIRKERSAFGAGEPTGKRMQVEFVSANPVGPMHVGHGRWAALGDSIARLLEHAGNHVEREFYINDAGVQMDIFAASVAARYMELCGREVEFPEDGYRGAYIVDIAREILDAEGDAWASASAAEREAHFKEQAYAQVLGHLKRVLSGMGVEFDVWFSERTLHERGPDGSTAIERAIERLREAGHVYEREGAIWFAATAFGDDKDRVLKKSDGEYTYFAADIAYHADKYDRAFDLVIDIWGADHHGYVKRMESAVAALGYPGQIELIIGQMVNLFRNGEIVRMSKRTGEMVTFEDLLDEVGPDAARYFFLRRSTDQSLDFDIGLAKEQSADNPVYYVQYAHARICSILRKAAGADTSDVGVDVDAVAQGIVAGDAALALLASEPDAASGQAELGLLRALDGFGDVAATAAAQRAPHKLATYAEELAAAFHQFYTHCQVVVEDDTLRSARLALADASRIVLARCLALLGVSAPERM